MEPRIQYAKTEDGVSIAYNVDLRSQLAERGPRETDSPVAAWFAINDLKQWYKKPEDLAALTANPMNYFASGGLDLIAAERDGQYYLLLYITDAKSITHDESKWAMVRTYPTIDNLGRQAVGFQLDAPGGRLMMKLTRAHVDEPMGIVLDGQVYSAPRINQPIAESGIIQGNFSESELNYLTRVLAAGSLEAKLSPEPIAMNTLGPSIGADNLHRGMGASRQLIATSRRGAACVRSAQSVDRGHRVHSQRISRP